MVASGRPDTASLPFPHHLLWWSVTRPLEKQGRGPACGQNYGSCPERLPGSAAEPRCPKGHGRPWPGLRLTWTSVHPLGLCVGVERWLVSLCPSCSEGPTGSFLPLEENSGSCCGTPKSFSGGCGSSSPRRHSGSLSTLPGAQLCAAPARWALGPCWATHKAATHHATLTSSSPQGAQPPLVSRPPWQDIPSSDQASDLRRSLLLRRPPPQI